MRIELREVTKRFGDHEAIRSVNLCIERQGLTVVGGPNGAGKSVLLKLMAGNLTPSDGQLYWEGLKVADHQAAYKFRIGYMPQAPAFYEDQTVATCLRYFARLKAIPAALVNGRVRSMLHLVRLENMARRRVKRLSGGERARLALGVALLNDPDLLLLDEPGANLDPGERIALWEFVGELKSARAVVMTSHVFAGLEGVVDRLIVLDEGRVMCDLPADEFIERAAPHVWEAVSPVADEPVWPLRTRVLHRRHKGAHVAWRLLAPGHPGFGARHAIPTLEDAYLWLRWQYKGKDELPPGTVGAPSPSHFG